MLREQGVLGGAVDPVIGQRFRDRTGGAGQSHQGEHDRDAEPHLDGRDEVEGDGAQRGEDEDQRVAAGGAQHRPGVVPLDHPVRGDQQDAGERDQRDPPDQPGGGVDDHRQHQRVSQRSDAGARAGPGVDRRPGDRPRGRQAAAQPGRDVGQPLPEQLPVGIVPRRRRSCRRRPAPTAGSPARRGTPPRPPHRPGRRALPRSGSAGSGSEEGSEPIRATCAPDTSTTTVTTATASRLAGSDRCSRGSAAVRTTDRASSPSTAQSGRRRTGPRPRRGRRRRSRRPAWRRRGAGHLLRGDHHRDAQGEALHQRPRHEGQQPAQPQHGRGHHEDAGQHRDRVDHTGAVLGDQRDQHHGHGAGRPGHLQGRAAEHRRHRTGDRPR